MPIVCPSNLPPPTVPIAVSPKALFPIVPPTADFCAPMFWEYNGTNDAACCATFATPCMPSCLACCAALCASAAFCWLPATSSKSKATSKSLSLESSSTICCSMFVISSAIAHLLKG